MGRKGSQEGGPVISKPSRAVGHMPRRGGMQSARSSTQTAFTQTAFVPLTLSDNVLEGAAAGDHGQHVLQRGGPRGWGNTRQRGGAIHVSGVGQYTSAHGRYMSRHGQHVLQRSAACGAVERWCFNPGERRAARKLCAAHAQDMTMSGTARAQRTWMWGTMAAAPSHTTW